MLAGDGCDGLRNAAERSSSGIRSEIEESITILGRETPRITNINPRQLIIDNCPARD